MARHLQAEKPILFSQICDEMIPRMAIPHAIINPVKVGRGVAMCRILETLTHRIFGEEEARRKPEDNSLIG